MKKEASKRAKNRKEALYRIIRVGKKTINQYAIDPNSYVVTWEASVNGKKREFVSYKCSTEGAALRHLHRAIEIFLKNSYEQSAASYAYKEGSNIQACVARHMHSDVFLKTDIHSFFTTIKKDGMQEKIERIINWRYKSIASTIVDCCYYDGKMPLGFITSPVLSDMYLAKLDACFADRQDIVYTRYADDFIISASGAGAETILQNVLEELRTKLVNLGLELNSKKTYMRRLRQSGDAIHLLGLNIVKTDTDTNRITVSDSYIRKTSIELCKLLYTKQSLAQEELQQSFVSVYGKIQFIKNSSDASAKKLKKMLSVKLNREITLDYSSLSSLFAK